MLPIKDSLKREMIDSLGLKTHLVLLGVPIFLLLTSWEGLLNISAPYNLVMVVCIYLFGYALSYYFHQCRLNRLWSHLQQVIHLNNTTFDLMNSANRYQDESKFLNALLSKAVNGVQAAEMGSIIRVIPDTDELYFESTIGIDIEKLRKINFNLSQSFEYRFSKGICDRVVLIDNMANINGHSTLTPEDQEALLTAPLSPIKSTLSSPIHIEGKLYGMLNLDSSKVNAFSHYDRNLAAVLTHEAANAIALYQKSHQIYQLANFDSLTELYNRQHFESAEKEWQINSTLGSYLVILDLDNLKTINDNAGHQAGDKALKSLASALKQQWHPKHLVARYGGDEFIALCYGPICEIEDDLNRIQQILAAQYSQEKTAGRQAIEVKFSFGIASYSRGWSRCFKIADDNMYQQKRKKQRVSLKE
ncbi:sensor domain-containing diguanylate cyclase [Shewanella sp. MBTL60-007]|uniref:sensor domain-containing diguanylate cyclase n=1 Tax=Shewanella sp. MBTL60-007 TaxID=2815911 RepID=UPI001BC39297|nr:sensor domain-containing diguanylate cyclase [Shewanella sp. MBTL60-007]GIU18350.1 GGDEF domain-containing protein [Shewanella sp. MBTL60-007]